MPKKFAGENSKAVAAKARKTAAKEAEAEKVKKKIEDSYWNDDDKNVQKKQQRKVSIIRNLQVTTSLNYFGKTFVYLEKWFTYLKKIIYLSEKIIHLSEKIIYSSEKLINSSEEISVWTNSFF